MSDIHSVCKVIASLAITAAVFYALYVTEEPVCLWALWIALLVWQ